MKNILLFVSGFVALFFFSRCNELDLEPLDAISEQVFYKTATDFKGAILASYSSMQSLNGTSTENLGECAEWWKMVLMASDEATYDPAQAGNCATNIAMDNLQFVSTDKAFQSVFTHLYQGIFRANLVLEKLEGDHELTSEEVAIFEAEAKFMRGWFHFQSYKFWGGQGPLALETRRDINNISLPNATPAETVAALVADFTDAAAGLPEQWDDANLGRATKGAALGYLGKTHLYAGNWADAVTALEQVYNSGTYSLMPNHEDAFAIDQENNAEAVFELQYGSNSDDNGWVLDDNHSENFKASQGWMRAWWQDAGNGAPGGGLGIYVPTEEMINAFEDSDTRRFSSIYKSGDTFYGSGGVSAPYDPAWSPTGSNLKKYRGENATKFTPVNFAIDYNNERLMRFADVILMLAEAKLETGDLQAATDLMNEVRSRSFPDGPAIEGDTQQELFDALVHERHVELAFEGHRLFDLVRWGIAKDVFTAQGKTFEPFGGTAIFPLPQSEIDRSGGVLNQVQ
jgi:hypothetical protein